MVMYIGVMLRLWYECHPTKALGCLWVRYPTVQVTNNVLEDLRILFLTMTLPVSWISRSFLNDDT